MRYEIRFSGFGGQGIITAGRIFAMSVIAQNPQLYIVYSPSYGFQTRGGSAMSDVIISDEDVDYPKASSLNVGYFLSQEAFNKFCGLLDKNGIGILDKSLVHDVSLCSGKKLYNLDIVKNAEEIGGLLFTSTIVLGITSYLLKNFASKETIEKTVSSYFKKTYMEKNLLALEKGYNLAKEVFKDVIV